MSETIRVYTPPSAGSFDPYTAAITGNIPRFFGFRELPPPPVLTPAPSPSVLGDGAGGDGGGGLGTGNVNMGGQMAGSIDLGPNPGNLDRGFGQQAYGQLGQAVGTLAGLATGVPGLGLGLGALGTLADVRGLNADLAMMGLPQDVALGPALASNMTFGMLGTPAATQFGNIMGFEALTEAPLSSLTTPQNTPAYSGNIADVAAAIAAAQAAERGEMGVPSADKSEPGIGGEKGDPGIGAFGAPDGLGEGWGDADFGGFADAQAAANEAAAAAAAADAAAAAAAADADAGAGSDAGDGEGGGDSGGGDGGDGGGGGDGGYYGGGLVKFAEGGLVPLAGGGKIAVGPGGGLDDLIPTSINGRRAAALSDGEFVIPADVVSMMGDGSSNAGARRLYDLVRQVRDEKTGTTKQAGPLPVGEILKRSVGR